ncbi:MAG TPA: hypothetical protein VK054_14065 [Beutenbergiaceae bacterium]|nr:hypothetical protein [Beutenbergiaceae bacterium]
MNDGSKLPMVFRALRLWTPRQWWAGVGFTVGFGVIVGISTVIIPNSIFSRDVPTVWWDYPVWLITSILSGLLAATYVRPQSNSEALQVTKRDQRAGRGGVVGAVLGWFAVGCPVCNKLALLALGYSGALHWFGAFQPVLAGIALVLVAVALVVRLRGQLSCPVQNPSPEVAVEA